MGSARAFPSRVASLFGGDLLRPRLLGPPEMRLGGADAAAKLNLDADVAHRHLRAGDRAKQHQLVQIAEMADAEQLARDLREPRAEREIVALIGDIDHV